MGLSEQEFRKMEDELCAVKEKNCALYSENQKLKSELDSICEEREKLVEFLKMEKAHGEEVEITLQKRISFLEGAVDAYQYALNSRR